MAVEGLGPGPDSTSTFAAAAGASGFTAEPLFSLAGGIGGTGAGAGAAGDRTARSWLLVRPPASFTAAAAAERVTNPWDLAHRLIGSPGSPGPLAALAASGAGPRLVGLEPDVARPDPDLERAIERRKQERKSCRSATTGREATICSEPSRHWPARPDPAWHLADGYSQLATARARVESTRDPASPPLRVVHLDTGFDDDHAALPAGLDRGASLDFTGSTPRPGGADPADSCFGCNPGHGTGTLSILAGAPMTIRDGAGAIEYDGALGGAPAVELYEYRVSPSVVHLTTGRMTRAFARALEDRADVLSMSMGGLPSNALGDAVDAAYEGGVAMFAASGDFLKAPLLPLKSPKSIVYPARFARVIAVTGATADRKSYAKAPSAFSWLRGGVGSWALRGSYGPPSAMGHALAAYTPNVPWAVLSNATPSNLLDLDGAGTSASTPQAAAAAALWLEAHRGELGAEWRGWQKSEAVYRALLDSATPGPEGADYARRYFGAGLLRAGDALDRPAAIAGLAPRERSSIGLGVVELIGSAGPFAAETGSTRNLRLKLLNLEAAQLVASSVELQKILGERDLSEPLPPEVRRRLLAALAEQPDASDALTQALATAR